jgi:hypothetical protein
MHPDFNVTKSDVKVRAAKVNKKPVNIGPKWASLSLFTPDSSIRN